jgi:hypothetical protein
MSLNLTSTITGSAITGLTSPTYTLQAGNNPSNNGKQSFVTALGGTQSGVTAHSASDVFMIRAYQPAVYKALNFVSSAIARKAPKNTYKVIFSKGVTFMTGQPKDISYFTFMVDVPAGSEALDAVELKALISCASGWLVANTTNLADSVVQNSI